MNNVASRLQMVTSKSLMEAKESFLQDVVEQLIRRAQSAANRGETSTYIRHLVRVLKTYEVYNEFIAICKAAGLSVSETSTTVHVSWPKPEIHIRSAKRKALVHQLSTASIKYGA